METHRFVRKNLVESSATADRYGLNLKVAHSSSQPASNQGSAENWSTEYWTNGTTTLLTVPSSKPLQNPSPVVPRSPVATSSVRYPVSNHRIMSSQAGKPPMTSQNSSSASNNLIRNSLLAGSLSGMASTIACHPFDVLRVKMQSTALASTPLGVSGTVRHTLQYGGFRALYTGLAVPLAAQAIYKGTVFTVNNITEQAIKEWKTQENYKLGNFTPHKLTLFDRFLSGFMGGAVNAALFVTPVEFVRNQQIAQMHGIRNTSEPQKNGIASPYSTRIQGPIAIVRSTLRSEGLTGLWRGMASTILRDSLGCGCFFAVMAYSQRLLMAHQETGNGPPSKSVLISSGAVAGVAFWVVGLPLDTMKTWIQNGSARNLQHAWEMSQREGFLNSIGSLNRGWQVAYGRGAPSAAITVTTYSLTYAFLNQTMD